MQTFVLWTQAALYFVNDAYGRAWESERGLVYVEKTLYECPIRYLDYLDRTNPNSHLASEYFDTPLIYQAEVKA